MAWRLAFAISTLCAGHVRGISIRGQQSTLPTDQQLTVSLGPKSQHEDCYGGFNAINPSFNYIPGSSKMAVAMRALCLHKTGDHAIWLSKVVLATTDASSIRQPARTSMKWNSLHKAPDPRTANASRPMVECQIPALDRADGPEDPRLVATPGGLFLVVAGYAVVPADRRSFKERPVCGERGFLLHAAKVESLDPPTFGPSQKLVFEGMGRVEKNWAMFVSSEASDATVHAVYSVYPHKIATVDLAQGHVRFDHETHSYSVVKLAKCLKVEPYQFHGGAGIAHVFDQGEEYFLSIMHVGVLNELGQTEYWNFPYKFQAKPPFAITHIGKRMFLKLEGNPIYGGELVAFVTTMLYDQGDVFVGYGSGDRSARTLRMSLAEFKHFYFPTDWRSSAAHIPLLAGLEEIPEIGPLVHSNNTPPACVHPTHKELCQDRLATSICRACP